MNKLFGEKEAAGKETIDLVRRYVIQETLAPIKALGRSLGYGVAGAVAIGLGLVFLLIGLLRALETETGSLFGGNWSFAPYGLTVVVALVAIGSLVVLTRRFPSDTSK